MDAIDDKLDRLGAIIECIKNEKEIKQRAAVLLQEAVSMNQEEAFERKIEFQETQDDFAKFH